MSKIATVKNLVLSPTARNTYAVFMSNIISAFFAFLFTVLLVRTLSLSDFGYFSALLSLLMLATELSDVGIGQSLSSFLPPLENKDVKLSLFLKAAFVTQLIIAILVSLAIVFASGFLSQLLFHTPRFSFLIMLTGLSIFASIVSNFIIYSLSARKKFMQVSFLTILGSVVRFVFIFVVVIFASINLFNSVIAQTASIIFYLLICLYIFNFPFLKVKFNNSDMKKLLYFAYLLGIARIFTGIAYRLDVLMLVSMKNATAAGLYSTASKVSSIYPMMVGSFLTVIAPKLSIVQGKDQLKKYTLKIILGTLGIISTILIMLIISKPFMLILFGAKTAPAIPIFRLLLVSMLFFVSSIPAVALAIFYFKKPHILTINSIIQLVIVAVANFFLIPVFAESGPAISLIIAYSLTLILTTLMTFSYWKSSFKVSK